MQSQKNDVSIMHLWMKIYVVRKYVRSSANYSF